MRQNWTSRVARFSRTDWRDCSLDDTSAFDVLNDYLLLLGVRLRLLSPTETER
jgi:aminoglycoside N3'-acetyltransferase